MQWKQTYIPACRQAGSYRFKLALGQSSQMPGYHRKAAGTNTGKGMA